MSNEHDPTWLEGVTELRDGYEVEAVERFADRLIRLAQSRMPLRLQQRIDPEDIVQSAFRSFFARNEDQQFRFQEIPDVWRLLAAITFRKVQENIRFHERQRRDVNRDTPQDDAPVAVSQATPTASSVVVMMELLDQILERVPTEHREIIQLRLENYSIDEIAERVGVSTRTVNRAIAVVRKIAADLVTKDET